MPAAAAMSLACEDELTEVRGRRDRGPERPERRLLLRRVAAQLLEPPDGVLQLLFWLSTLRDLVAGVVELARRRREQQEVPEQDEDEASGDARDQRGRRFMACPAGIVEAVRARGARDARGRREVHEVTAARRPSSRRPAAARSAPRGSRTTASASRCAGSRPRPTGKSRPTTVNGHGAGVLPAGVVGRLRRRGGARRAGGAGEPVVVVVSVPDGAECWSNDQRRAARIPAR